MAKLFEFWKRLSLDVRFAIMAFLVVRISLSLWSLVIYEIFPVSLQNLNLFDEPVVTVFSLHTSEEHVYSRYVGDKVLTFHVVDSQYMVDDQSGSIWPMRNGKALKGKYAGESLAESSHTVGDIFPYLGVSPTRNETLALWQRFDTNWYLRIAAYGYQGLAGSTAYFPLYPLLIRAFSFVIGPMFSAVLISNLALIGALVLLYRLVSNLADEQSTRRAVIYFLVFPTSFFFMAGYTESLFVLFTIGSLFSASRRNWAWAVILGMLSALTRLQGALLFVPLMYMLWGENKYLSIKEIFIRALPLSIIPLATLAFFGYSNFSTFNALQSAWHARFVFPWDNVWASISLLRSPDGSIIDVMNLSVTLGFIIMMFAVWKKLPLEYSFYSLLMLLTPLFRMNSTQPLVSMTRYVLVIFPVFIVFGMWGKNPWINRVILYISVLLQLYLSAQFFLWGWVA
jgi:Gpi18-like mannosyltransferase